MISRKTAARWVLIASIILGVSYVASWDRIPHGLELTWKGAGVGLLAVYAAMKACDLDGRLLAAVLAFGALGDVLLEVGLVPGALAFLAGHLVAIVLYLRNRRKVVGFSQMALAVVLVPATVFIAWQLPADRAGATGVAVYALGLALMAATAWVSRFPRFVVGIGAILFLISDLLIFARTGPLEATFAVNVAVWHLYYIGQLMICVGVTGALAHWRETAGKERVTGDPRQ